MVKITSSDSSHEFCVSLSDIHNLEHELGNIIYFLLIEFRKRINKRFLSPIFDNAPSHIKDDDKFKWYIDQMIFAFGPSPVLDFRDKNYYRKNRIYQNKRRHGMKLFIDNFNDLWY